MSIEFKSITGQTNFGIEFIARESEFFHYAGVRGANRLSVEFLNRADKAATQEFRDFFMDQDIPLTLDHGVRLPAKSLRLRRENMLGMRIVPDLTEQAMLDMGVEP